MAIHYNNLSTVKKARGDLKGARELLTRSRGSLREAGRRGVSRPPAKVDRWSPEVTAAQSRRGIRRGVGDGGMAAKARDFGKLAFV